MFLNFHRACLTILFSMSFVLTSKVQANVCGTDYQNFNPTTNGLDFVTVHSSETLKPCYLNFGAFVNYAVNTLTYSENFTDSDGNQYQAGEKPNDKIWGLDLSFGMGINDKWDFGVSVPFVLDQDLEEEELNSNYKSKGATEIKLNTKYRLRGDETGGVALIASLNHNLIKNNPFVGDGAKPTLNFEVAADTTLNLWSFGANLGYRWRNQGEPIEGVPFEPLGNQMIYSLASSYYFTDLDTKVIFEVFGGKYFSETNEASEKNPNSLEWLVGFKHDVSHNMALHFGGGTQLASAIGSPEQRIYFGLNWALGPFCKEDKEPEVVAPVAVATVVTEPEPVAVVTPRQERIRYSAEVLFDFDSADLRNADIPEVDTYFNNLDRTQISKIIVEGHTDSRGHPDYNVNLSQRRADTVKKYLLGKYSDIQPEKIETVGYGAARPVADNGNYQGRQKNRRVEFVINIGE